MKEFIKRIPPIKIKSLTSASGLLAASAVAAPSLFDHFNTKNEYRWIALGLFFVFVFLLAVREHALAQRLLTGRVYLALQTILVLSLLSLPPNHEFVIILFFILSAEATTIDPGKKSYLWIVFFTIITTIVFCPFIMSYYWDFIHSIHCTII